MNFLDHPKQPHGPTLAVCLVLLALTGCETPANDVGLEPQPSEPASATVPSITSTDTEVSVEESPQREEPALFDTLEDTDGEVSDTSPQDAAPALETDAADTTTNVGPVDTEDALSDTQDGQPDENLGAVDEGVDTYNADGPEVDASVGSDVEGGGLPVDCDGLEEDTLCDDGDPCTLDDACREGVCTGAALDCSDKDPCTEDEACVEGTCTSTMWPDGKVCDGANGCAFEGTCQQGTCEPEAPLCPSDDPCKIGECVDEVCLFESAPNFTLCDDGDACTVYDRCLSGFCYGSPMNCKDGEPCTVDSCSPDTGECLSELLEDCVPGTPADFTAPDVNPNSASFELETSLASFTGKILVGIFHSPS
ncbi:MAG: hypothetical protein ACPGU1_17525 [Myxococcota bacterium]